MKYIFFELTILLVAIGQQYVSANLLTTGAGLIGVEIKKECKAVVDKWTEIAKKEIFEIYIKKEKCGKAKCKPNFDEVIKYWPQVKRSVELILNKVAEKPKDGRKAGPNVKALPDKCKTFQKDLNRVLWGEADKIADQCVLKPGSPGYNEIKGQDPCTITKEKLSKTGACIKEKAVPLAMGIVGLRMQQVQDCFNYVLDQYCNEEYLGAWFEYNLRTAMKDRSCYGKYNAYNCMDKYFDEYNCIAHPIS